MKINKKILVSLISIGVIGVIASKASTAPSTHSSAEILAELTGQSVERITAERSQTGLTYADLAAQYGILDEYSEQVIQSNKGYLKEAIDEGKMTEEEAEDIIANIVQAQEICSLSDKNACF